MSCAKRLIESGEIDAAIDLLVMWTDRATNPDTVLPILALRSRALLAAERYEECFTLSERALADATRRESNADLEAIHVLRISVATCLRTFNRADESSEQLEAIRRELLGQPDSAVLAWCAFQLGNSQNTRGNRAVAKRYIIEAIVSAQRCGDLYLQGMALQVLSASERHQCRWAAAHEAAIEAHRICLEINAELPAGHARRATAMIGLRRGHLNAAIQAVDQYLEGLARIGRYDGDWGWYGVLIKGLVLLHGGEFTNSLELMTSVPRWQTADPHSRPALLTTEFLGDVHLEQGQAKEALALYDEVFPKAMALVPKGDIVAELRRRRAECYYLLGRFDEAHAEAKIALEHCRELGDRYEEAATYRVLALTSAAVGKPGDAHRWFEQGFAYYDDIETPYEWGKLWLAYGDWLRGPHAAEYADANGVLEAYRAARDHFERMGAKAKLAEAEARVATMTEAPPTTRRTLRPREVAPRRRPRGHAELERRSKWALDTFGLLTANKPLLRLLDDVAKLARSTTPILVLGESGTGKELIAHGIHRVSGRLGLFVPINCSSVPRETIESELYGHVRGSFTGAVVEKAGLLEVCDRGTAFLDEIGEMPLDLQARLLRFLETGELRRVGATKQTHVDTRIVAATNRDQATLERGEHFRADLYYRLAHAVVVLPPLRRRGDDVELLAFHFLDEACREQGKDVGLSDAGLSAIRAHPWPGNVRELKAVLKRAVILAPNDHDLTPAELSLGQTVVPVTLLEEMEQNERSRIADALKAAGNSRTEAAKALGIPRTTLIHKIRRFGLG